MRSLKQKIWQEVDSTPAYANQDQKGKIEVTRSAYSTILQSMARQRDSTRNDASASRMSPHMSPQKEGRPHSRTAHHMT